LLFFWPIGPRISFLIFFCWFWGLLLGPIVLGSPLSSWAFILGCPSGLSTWWA
jgi:hypothetical protein